MKKEKKIQQFEKIIDSNEQLGLQMKDLKGGAVAKCAKGTSSGTSVICNVGTVSFGTVTF